MKRARKSSPGARTVGAVLHGGVYLLKHAVVIYLGFAVIRRVRRGVRSGRLDSRGKIAQRGIEASAVESFVHVGEPTAGVGAEDDSVSRDGFDLSEIRCAERAEDEIF